MVHASRARARAAEGRVGAIPTQPTPASSAAAGTSLSRRAPQADGTRGITRRAGSPRPTLCPQVREREQERAAPLRPTPRSRGRNRAEGAPASLQDVRLAARLPDPPAATAAIGIPGTLPRHLAGASVPCAPPPRDRTSPERFPKQTLRCKRTHTLTHTHNAPRGVHSCSPALGFGVPGTILSFPLVRGGWITSPHARERGRKGKSRGSRGQWAHGRSRVGGQGPGGAGWQALGTEQDSPEGGFTLAAAEEGGERRRNKALGSVDGSHCPVPSRSFGATSPTRGARQVLSRPAPGPVPPAPGSLFLPFLLPFPRSGRLRFLPRLSLKLRPRDSSQNNKGRGGMDGGGSERGREQESERHPGICSSGSGSGVVDLPAALAAWAPSPDPVAGKEAEVWARASPSGLGRGEEWRTS